MKLLALLILVPTFVGAATNATLFLKGTIPSILSIAVTAETVATSLPLTTSQTATKIATVTERSNNLNGYSVNIVSANLGKLVLNPANYIPYSLTYNNLAVNLSGATGQTFSNSFVSAAAVDKDVKITYTGVSNAVAGDYSDTLTFTITAN